jgi:hypothetical protein
MSIEKKLAKILELAERGVGGERKNAQFILEKLLRKHNLSLKDIAKNHEEKKAYRWFPYKTKYDKRLLFQIYVSITKSKTVKFRQGRGRKEIAFEMTELDLIELEEAYKYYKKLYQKELGIFFEAFVRKHELLAPCDKSDGGKEVDLGYLVKVQKMMKSMNQSEFISTRKRLVG